MVYPLSTKNHLNYSVLDYHCFFKDLWARFTKTEQISMRQQSHESMPRRIKAVLKVKGGQTQY